MKVQESPGLRSPWIWAAAPLGHHLLENSQPQDYGNPSVKATLLLQRQRTHPSQLGTIQRSTLAPPPHPGRGTHIDVVNVQDTGVELEAQSLGLLDRVGQLAVGLQQKAKHAHGTGHPQASHAKAPRSQGHHTPQAGSRLPGRVSGFQLMYIPERALTPGVTDARSTQAGATLLLARVTHFPLITKSTVSPLLKAVFISEVGNAPGTQTGTCSQRGKLRPLWLMQNILLWILAWNQMLFSRIHPAPRLHWGELTGSARFSLTRACGWLSAAGSLFLLWGKDTIALSCLLPSLEYGNLASQWKTFQQHSLFMPLMDPPNERKKRCQS